MDERDGWMRGRGGGRSGCEGEVEGGWMRGRGEGRGG